MLDLRADAITDPQDFRGQKEHWEKLYSESVESFPMISFDWLDAWWESFGSDAELHIVNIWKDNELIFAAPLCIVSTPMLGLKQRVLRFMSNERVDRMHFLFHREPFHNPTEREQIFDLFFEHIKSISPKCRLLSLKNIDADSELTRHLLSYLENRRHIFGVDEGISSPYLTLPDNWNDLLSQVSSSFRQSLRRKIRKADKTGLFSYTIHRQRSFLEPLIKISSKTWQHDAGTAMFSEPQISDFYTKVIESAADNGTLYSATVEYDGKPIAYEFNLLCNSTLHNFKLGFDKDHPDLSAGLLLKSHILQALFNEDRNLGIREYDFMGSCAAYKLNWSKKIRRHITLHVYSRNIIALGHYLMKYIIKRRLNRFAEYVKARRDQ